MAHFTAGDPVGRPLQEWAYVTPRFPQGIRTSALGRADQHIQRETAAYWFLLNLKPYEPPPSPPRRRGAAINESPINAFSTNGGPLPDRPLDELEAYGVLAAEFEQALSMEMLEEIGKSLGFTKWMWVEEADKHIVRFLTRDEGRIALDKALEQLAKSLSELHIPAAHGQIGHNLPPDALPLTQAEKGEFLSRIALLRREISAGADAEELENAWSKIKPKLAEVRNWCIEQSAEILVDAGKTYFRTLAVGTAVSLIFRVFYHGATASQLIDALKALG